MSDGVFSREKSIGRSEIVREPVSRDAARRSDVCHVSIAIAVHANYKSIFTNDCFVRLLFVNHYDFLFCELIVLLEMFARRTHSYPLEAREVTTLK